MLSGIREWWAALPLRWKQSVLAVSAIAIGVGTYRLLDDIDNELVSRAVVIVAMVFVVWQLKNRQSG